MSAVLTSPAAQRLPSDWQEWLAGSIMRGVGDDELFATMSEAGFEKTYATVAISVVRSLTESVREQGAAALAQYQADATRLPSGSRVRAADREVGIAFALSDPNLALLTELLSGRECAKLIEFSSGKLRRSEVVARADGEFEVSVMRTSEGTHFERGENTVVRRLEQRLAALTGVPVENGEPLQILHYGVGGEYRPHHDYFDPAELGSAALLEHGGQRIATIVIYLNAVESGGETTFPELDLAIRPRPGSAVYFEYSNARGEVDSRCLHAGAPVAGGEKWIATKWLRQRPYRR